MMRERRRQVEQLYHSHLEREESQRSFILSAVAVLDKKWSTANLRIKRFLTKPWLWRFEKR